MRVRIVEYTRYRSEREVVDHNLVEVTGSMEEFAKIHRLNHGSAGQSKAQEGENGAWGYGDNDGCTVFFPEGHPSFDLDYDRFDDWDETTFEKWKESLGSLD